jgi:GNAT superfamily N-acetyltransferase
MPVDIRRLHPDDADDVLRLAHLAGWNQTGQDVRRLLALEPDGCFAACESGQVVGTTTTTCYGTVLAWVGMVLVDPPFRRRGIASALMETALDYLRNRGVKTIKLDATPAGQPVYERLGFMPEVRLERWEGVPTPRSGAATESGKWEDIAATDRQAFGADRGGLLRIMLGDTDQPPVLVRDQRHEVIGYALNRPGSRARYVGPVIADSRGTAESLLAALLGRVGTGRVFIDLNPEFPGAIDLVQCLGFTRQRELLRMRLGPEVRLSVSRRVFAIAGPEVG